LCDKNNSQEEIYSVFRLYAIRDKCLEQNFFTGIDKNYTVG